MIKEILNKMVVWLAKKEDIMNGFNTIGIDFDGVIMPIPEGKLYQDDLSEAKPDPDMMIFMNHLRTGGYTIVIFSSRVLFGKASEIERFLDCWDIPYDLVTAIKYPCLLYVDDSAVFYKANCPESNINKCYEILDRKHEEINSLDLARETQRLRDEGLKTFSSR